MGGKAPGLGTLWKHETGLSLRQPGESLCGAGRGNRQLAIYKQYLPQCQQLIIVQRNQQQNTILDSCAKLEYLWYESYGPKLMALSS